MLRDSLQRRLRMEVLEDKRPLAANLFAEVIDGDLVITGDAGDNRFYIQSGLPDGEQYELGNIGNLDEDTINGLPFNSADHFFSGVTGDIIINLGDGGDYINIRGTNEVVVLDMPGDLRIDMGAGDDRIVLGTGEGPLADYPLPTIAFPLNIAGDLILDMGAGYDQTWIASTTVGRDFSYTASGDNFLMFAPESLFEALATGNAVGRDFSVITGAGNDAISLEDIDVGRNVLISLDDGDDFVALTDINVAGLTLASLGTGTNEAQFEFSNLGSSLTVLGGGSNSIFIADVVTSSMVNVVTANGNDAIVLGGVQTGTAIVTTGGGDDELFVLDSVFDNLLVTLGGGDDTLTIGGTQVNGLALLSGGSGFDTLVNLGDNDFLLALALAFESRVS